MKYFTFNSRFFLFFIFLFITEVLIANYVHDLFIRPFVGDVLVVILIYSFFKIFLNIESKTIALAVFIFAIGIELLQLFQFVKLLHLEHNKIMKIAIGSVFDLKDIIAYFIGYLICIISSSNKNQNTVYKP